MTKLALSTIIAMALIPSGAAIACDKPMKVSIPNGESASKREMVEIQDTIRSYVAEMGVYLECIVTEEKLAQRATEHLSPQAEQNRLDQLDKKYNAAIDEMEEVILSHNREAKKFREKEKT